MKRITKKIVKVYGIWVLLWLCVAGYGALFSYHGEFGVSSHLLLTITGLPLSLLSWHVKPNGTVLCVLVAGIIGLVQWGAIVEINARYDEWRNSRKNGN